MPVAPRAHAVAAAALVALVPLAPAVLWLSASVDRDATVAANERVLASRRQPDGARPLDGWATRSRRPTAG